MKKFERVLYYTKLIKNKKVKQEHIIPRYYLEKFSKDNKLFVYKLDNFKVFRQNITKIAKENDFYDFDEEISSSIGVETQYIEHDVFSLNIEPDLLDTLDKLKLYTDNFNSYMKLDDELKTHILFHIYYMMCRNRKFKEVVLSNLKCDSKIAQQLLICGLTNYSDFMDALINMQWEIIINET